MLYYVFTAYALRAFLTYQPAFQTSSYLKNKKRQMWVFLALGPLSKFWINFETGSRTNQIANRLLKNLKALVKWNPTQTLQTLKVTTDKLAAYKNALEKQLGELPYVYLQIVKQRVKRKLKTVKKIWVKGVAEDFPLRTQNTSYIERLNLTLRQKISYSQRKTIGYYKKKTNLNRTLWINLFDYNYAQLHQSLRIDLTGQKIKFQKRYKEMTPAMKMGLKNIQLSWRDLLIVPIPKSG